MLLLALLCTVPQVKGKARSDSNATTSDQGMLMTFCFVCMGKATPN